MGRRSSIILSPGSAPSSQQQSRQLAQIQKILLDPLGNSKVRRKGRSKTSVGRKRRALRSRSPLLSSTAPASQRRTLPALTGARTHVELDKMFVTSWSQLKSKLPTTSVVVNEYVDFHSAFRSGGMSRSQSADILVAGYGVDLRALKTWTATDWKVNGVRRGLRAHTSETEAGTVLRHAGRARWQEYCNMCVSELGRVSVADLGLVAADEVVHWPPPPPLPDVPVGQPIPGFKQANVDARRNTMHLTCDMRTSEAVTLLMELGAHRAPVFDPETESYIGVFGLEDMVRLMVEIHKCGTALRFSGLEELMEQRGSCDTLRGMCGVMRFAEFSSVQVTTPLVDVARTLSEGAGQVYVMDPLAGLVSYLDPNAVVAYLLAAQSRFEKLCGMTLETLGVRPKRLVQVEKMCPVLDALYKLNDNHVPAVAVVDSHGHFVGSLHSSDLSRLLLRGRMGALEKPIVYYMDELRSRRNAVGERYSSGAPLVCEIKSTFVNVLKGMSINNVHRVFVVNSHNHPVGVVSLRDLLHRVLNM